MSIKVLLVDGSDVMRSAIRQLLKNELGIEVIGTATSFAETIVLAAALKPDVLLMDPRMPDEREYKPAFVKSQTLSHTKCIVAISLWKDADTKTLAETFGAHVLLDKMNLYSDLIPAIKQFCPSVAIPKTRRVSTTLRHMLTEFSEFFHVSWTGLLIHASVGTAGGLGALRTKRSG
jgi:DNA-binding NarL/FixJ family response regulator